MQTSWSKDRHLQTPAEPSHRNRPRLWRRRMAASALAACAWLSAGAFGPHPAFAETSEKTPAPPKTAPSEAERELAEKRRQNAVSVAFLQGQRPAAPDAIATLGTDMFGDKINLYNGSFSVEHTDVMLPGSSALRVALDRQHAPGRQTYVRGMLADWDLNTPRIEGTFADVEGFVPAFGTPANRCSGFNMPPQVSRPDGGPAASQDFSPDEYWHGTNLVVPGHGSQEILRRAQLPNADASWTLVTRGLWKLRCLNALRNAPGQGFLAVSPEGVTYYFDWLASRESTPLRKGDAVLARRDVYLMATRVVDRFGNQVEYRYEPSRPLQLNAIVATDGRSIALNYSQGRLASVSDGTRNWTYHYGADGDLRHVVLPDQSRWTFSLGTLVQPAGSIIDEQNYQCDSLPSILGVPRTGSIWHPSGAQATFGTNFVYHGRTEVQRACTTAPGTKKATTGSVFPHTTVSQTLESKTITGPGMVPMTWEYNASNVGAFAPCGACADRKSVVVKEPGGSLTRHTFGIRWRVNDGQLLKVEHADAFGNVFRSKDIRYRVPTAGEFPDSFGTSVRITTDLVSTLNRPEDRRETSQQGVSFLWEVEGPAAQGFDTYARPVRTRAASSLGYARTLHNVYRDFPAIWVLGQTESVVERSTNLEIERTEFHASSALPWRKFSFGRLTGEMTYHPNGMLKDLRDGAGKTTSFDDYKLGQPQRAVFADGRAARQLINNLGAAENFTNEVQQTTRFQFDAMGRVNRVMHPAESWGAYCDTTISFWQSTQPDRGMPAGHWRQSVRTCNGVTDRWLDGLWRVRLEERRDDADPANTRSVVETRYDAAGNKSFESYPQREPRPVDTPLFGVSHAYDPLQRLVRTQADSERGLLVTQVNHLANFERQVTNPRNQVTRYAYQAFDEPTEGNIVRMQMPEGVEVGIDRDVFGKARSITRYGSSASGFTSVTRQYTYNPHQQLCKTVEPETGATVQGYDAAGNLAWRASGRPASAGCSPGEHPANVKVEFNHDLRNRLESTRFGDQLSPPILRSYTPDGLLEVLSAGDQVWTYGYNNRRILVSERLTARGQNLPLNWGIDAYGNRASLTFPNGVPLAYAPNALGQPTAVTSGGFVLASNVRYHPNGAIQQYVLSNQVVHTQTQNRRGLPEQWRHSGLVDTFYSYDEMGNVVAITNAQVPHRNQAMVYDGLDRLRLANGPWGAAEYRYDAVDNLRYSQVGGRSLTHLFDPARNLLVGVTGSLDASIGYDANGNVSSRAGQFFSFDVGNRLLSSSRGLSFAYDGHGRRTRVDYPGGDSRLQMFSSDGKLVYGHHTAPPGVPTDGQTLYVHLQDRLIAEFNASTGVLHYVHTDALGSPVVKSTNTQFAAEVTGSRRWHEPYGFTEMLTSSSVGFTGHFQDRETELVYMQQRYYDPVAGRFLSVDPVTTDAGNGALFNRYMYAANNPFRFVDPDGRCTGSRLTNSDGTCISTGGFSTGLAGLAQGMQIARAASVEIPQATRGAANLAGMVSAQVSRTQTPLGFFARVLGLILSEGADSSSDTEPPVPGATPGRETKGRTTQWDKGGGMDEANRDFDAKGPKDVVPLPDGGRRGTLPDGRQINVRPDSSGGLPTLEIQDGKNRDKVRYGP